MTDQVAEDRTGEARQPSGVLPRLRQRQDGGMDQLVRALAPVLRAFFRNRLGNEEAAADFTQETFLRFTQAGYGPAGPDVKALLFSIARNLFFDHLRRVRRERAYGFLIDHLANETELLNLAGSEAPADERLAARQELAAVRDAVGELPPRCAQVFLMHRVQGRSQKEIAAELGISVSVVEKHFKRALVRLAAAIGRTRR